MSGLVNHPAEARKAVLYRMVMPRHTCPYGLKAKDLLKRAGYEVEDHHLTTRKETDDFKAKHGVATTPQLFIGGKRIGGYDDLRRFLGKPVNDPEATSYRPVIALFTMTALVAMAASYAVMGNIFTIRAAEWFIGFSMVVLALLILAAGWLGVVAMDTLPWLAHGLMMPAMLVPMLLRLELYSGHATGAHT